MYKTFFENFYKQNKSLVIGNTLITLIIYPIELLSLSYLSGSIFYAIKNNNIRKFLIMFILFSIMFIVICFLFWISEKLDGKMLPRLKTSIRKDILNHLLENNKSYKILQSGDVLNKINNIPEFVYMNYVNVVTYILPLLFSILFFVLFMFLIHYKLGLLTLCFFVIFLIVFYLYCKKTINIAKERYILDNKLMNSFDDLIKNSNNIITNNKKDYEKNLFYRNNYNYQSNLKKEINSIYDIKLIFISLLLVFFIILVAVACFLYYKNQLSLFKLIIFVSAIMVIIKSFHSLIKRTADSMSYVAPLFYQDELGFFNSSLFHQGKRRDFFKDFKIQLVNASFLFKKKVIFKNVNIEIPFKSKIIITGDIGTGKSTFFRILVGQMFLTSGSLLYDNVDINDIDLKYLRDYIIMMNQHIILFQRSVLENIFYGESFNSLEWNKKLKKLKSLSIYPKIKSFVKSKTTSNLSGGQKQIILLLRTYFRNPKILLLDEPTANVDTQTKDLIIEILSLLKESTIICITHDQTILKHFDIHYHLENYQFTQK
jgi:ABC-type bacteriocin/lantibiotic exporter with double-glycine peptidase domain